MTYMIKATVATSPIRFVCSRFSNAHRIAVMIYLRMHALRRNLIACSESPLPLEANIPMFTSFYPGLAVVNMRLSLHKTKFSVTSWRVTLQAGGTAIA